MLFAELADALQLVERLLQKPFTSTANPGLPMLLPRFVMFEVDARRQLVPVAPEKLPVHLPPERVLNLQVTVVNPALSLPVTSQIQLPRVSVTTAAPVVGIDPTLRQFGKEPAYQY